MSRVNDSEPFYAPVRTNRQLSDARQQLVRTMQFISYGRIERLQIVKSDPKFVRNTVVLRTIRMTGNNQSRPELASDDFALKRELVELFAQFDQIGDGQIMRLEVCAGLPQLMVIRQSPLAS